MAGNLPHPLLWLVVAALVTASFLAGRYSLEAIARPQDEASAPAPELWTVRAEQVGRTLDFVGDLSLRTRSGPSVQAAGIITDLLVPEGKQVQADEELLRVGLRPVVAAEGRIPAFRDIGPKVQGADVTQLRRFLCDLGRLLECDNSPRYTRALADGIKAWQKSHGVEGDGLVGVGDIVWFNALPARVRIAPKVEVGQTLAAGDHPFDVAAATPVLNLTVTRDQVTLVPVGAPVRIGSLRGVVTGADPVATSDDAMTLRIAGKNGRGSICHDAARCRALLEGGTSVKVKVKVDTVPQQSGPAVPVRAVQTAEDGSTYVVRPDGSHCDVQVLASASGLAVVNGVEDGDQIRMAVNG